MEVFIIICLILYCSLLLLRCVDQSSTSINSFPVYDLFG
jgi:hypothetical protein